MKSLMYHYVRPEPGGLRHYRYLHADDFCRQLDHLAEAHGLLSRDAFERAIETGTPEKGAVLTFDDGFADHYNHVLPVLKERGLWGIFYIPTGTYRRNKLLDVHRVHVLLGHFGGAKCMEMLLSIVRDDMLVDRQVEAFRNKTYAHQENDAETVRFKRMLNYYVSYEWRETLLDQMMKILLDGEEEERLFERFYLTPAQIREMDAMGMVIGSHGVDHLVMSKLSIELQRQEIEESCAFLADILGRPVETFCYPYGAYHTFTSETEELLERQGIKYSFCVDSRDIDAADLVDRPHALPRYNCTDFPHGRATIDYKSDTVAESEKTSSTPGEEIPAEIG